MPNLWNCILLVKWAKQALKETKLYEKRQPRRKRKPKRSNYQTKQVAFPSI